MEGGQVFDNGQGRLARLSKVGGACCMKKPDCEYIYMWHNTMCIYEEPEYTVNMD